MADHDPVIIKAAEAFVEPYCCVHLCAVNGNRSAPWRLIAMIVGKRELPIALPPDSVDEEVPDR